MMKAIAISIIAGLVVLNTSCTTTTYSGKTGLNSTNLSSADKKIRRQDALDTSVKLGLAYLREGNQDGARFHLQKALKSHPKSAAANNGMALLYQLEKETELAREYYLKALRYEPDHTATRNNYAIFLLSEGKNDEAYAELIRAATDLDYPRRARVYASLGDVANRLGKTEEAITAWEKSININPSMAPSYIELATVYYAQNKLPLAKRYLRKYDELVGPRARALWLGVRLEDAFGNKDGVASKGLALEKMYPYSQQYLDYQQWLKNP